MITIRNNNLIIFLPNNNNRISQKSLSIKIHQRLISKFRIFINFKLNQNNLRIQEIFHINSISIFQSPLNFLSSIILRIYKPINTHGFSHKFIIFNIPRITKPNDSRFSTLFLSNHRRNQINIIIKSHCNKSIALIHISLIKNSKITTIAQNSHNIVLS